MYKEKIIKILQEIIGKEDIKVEVPPMSDLGDYTTNVALIYAKGKGKTPKELAKEIVSKIKTDIFEKIEIAGPGFINFYIKKDVLVDSLIQIDGNYGKSDQGKGKVVVIDYSAPNIAKPFGIGHLRSTIIGQAIYNLYSFLGYKVIGDNHLGDWGTQFGKLLYMIDTKKPKNLDIDALEKLYVEFHQLEEKDPSLSSEARSWFKKLEEGDGEARKIWQECVDVSLKEFTKIYDLLNVKIDYAYGESFYEDLMEEMAENEIVKKNLQTGEDGKSKIINLEKFGISTPLMFLKSDGASTYATRDLATIKFRMQKWNPDIIVYEVGAEQTLHFRQVFAAARLLGLVNDNTKLIHVAHGLYLSPDGKKFSTRKGKTIKLEEVLNEAVIKAKELGSKDEKTAKMVGIGAIKYFDLMHSVGSDVVFDWEKILNLQGNSGPYLQYTLARIKSLLAKKPDFKGLTQDSKTLQGLNPNKLETGIIGKLLHFPEVVRESATMFSPNLLCNYIYQLSSEYNSFYNANKIIGGENEELKLQITKAVGEVLENGLKLLGIDTPERM